VQLDQLRRRLAAREMKLVISDDAKKLLAEEGYDPTFGARPLKRVIQQRIENPLAQKILAGEFGEGVVIQIDVGHGKREFTFALSNPSRRERQPSRSAPAPVG
jgi:ATP-dependent Clp protease ATP-binding subunit ClpB